MAKRIQTIYAMGLVRGRSIHYLATRETNFARARHTALSMVKDNKRWSVAVVCKVLFNRDGTERDLKELWRSRKVRRASKRVLEEKL
jgi:hypothetical protein